MGRELHFLFLPLYTCLAVCAIHGHADHALGIVVVVVHVRLFIIHAAAARGRHAAGKIAIQNALVVARTGVDGGGRVGHQVVAHVRKGALHSC